MTAETAQTDPTLTPAERRRAKVRDAILCAAEDIFAEEGEAGISMRRIAERIDYSPAALYKYFDSKEALFDEIREQFFERLLTRMRTAYEHAEEGPALTEECLRAYVETGLEQPCHYRLAFSGCVPEDAPAEGSFALAAAQLLEEMIERSIADGWFEAVHSGMAAKAVWAGAHGLTMLAVTLPGFPDGGPGPGGITLDGLIDFQGRMILRGMASEKLRQRLGG